MTYSKCALAIKTKRYVAAAITLSLILTVCVCVCENNLAPVYLYMHHDNI